MKPRTAVAALAALLTLTNHAAADIVLRTAVDNVGNPGMEFAFEVPVDKPKADRIVERANVAR